MKRKVYIETSVVRYLTARPSRDLRSEAERDWPRAAFAPRRVQRPVLATEADVALATSKP